MGVRGAAIATVLSRCITFSVALYILIVREKIVSIAYVEFSERVKAWKDILYIGVPNALTKMIQPLGIGIITKLLATEGLFAVAGYGVASKVERFALIFIMSISVVMTPFVGQNYGAGKLDRVREGVKSAIRVSLWSSVAVYIVLLVSCRTIGNVYSEDPKVVEALVFYLRSVPLFYGAYGIIQIVISVLNAINKPFQAAFISVSLMFLVYIPLATVTKSIWGYHGIFLSLAISYVIVAIVSYFFG